MIANARRHPSRQSLALAAILALALAGCATHNSDSGGLVKDSPAVQPESAPSPAEPESSPIASAPAAGEDATTQPPAGTGALEAAPTGQAPTAQADSRHLERIHFAFDSYLLDEPARATLHENAEVLADSGPTPVRVEGYCDERGSAEYNLALGERRAQSAADYLRDLGVSPDRLQVVSYGEERPLDGGHSELAWANNRRAEFVEVTR